MDAIQQIAEVFEKDCVRRLQSLERAQAIIEYSENSEIALRLIFIQAEIYADDIEHLKAVLPEIERLRSCIQSTGVMIQIFWTCFMIITNTSYRKQSSTLRSFML